LSLPLSSLKSKKELSHVVIQTAFIGDLFLSVPFLRRLKKNNPDHQIILICKKGLGQFFIHERIVDQVFEIQKGQSHSYNDVLKQLSLYHIDHVYCLHRSVRSLLLSFKMKAQKKYGFSDSFFFFSWRSLFFTRTIKYPRKWPEVIRQMSLLTLVDPSLQEIINSQDWTSFNFPLKNSLKFEAIPSEFKFNIHDIESLNDKNRSRKVAIFPGSVWATKKWSALSFSELTEKLLQSGCEVFIMGGPEDVKESQTIFEANPQAKMLTGRMSLTESALFLKSMDLIICNDSAPAHMAAFFQRPVLALFGPTVLDFGFRPWDDKSQVVQNIEISCRPCGPHGHHQCPLWHHRCMKTISSDLVFIRAQKMLEE
jgi:heptosyltransferase II